MMKTLIFLLLIPFVVFSQIRPNRNIDSKELTYRLISDTLHVKSTANISSITFRCGDFRMYYLVGKKETAIDVLGFPQGYYTIIAITNRKIITFNLTK